MGKLTNRLKQQLKRVDHKKDAEECIDIYNWIKSTTKGSRVWNSRWSPLVDVAFKKYPSNERNYRLNIVGKTLLKGIKKN